MGFRGEALASIAAISHTEIRTRRAEDNVGTRLLVESSVVQVQEGCQCPVGTSILVRNLFFNVPARRKFLKTDPVEMRHILDEFHHLALAFENIHFKLYHQEQEVYNLPAGSLRTRILNIFGKKINEFLVPVEEETNYVNVAGYIGKPKLGKKTRGEQFLFVNRRYIKSPYLQHAVKSAYEDILPDDLYPFFVVFLEINAARIDVNVHPTKQEIKFEDERIIYNYLRVACRHALGKYSITPSLDFEQEVAIDRATQGGQEVKTSTAGMTGLDKSRHQEKENIKKWEALLESIEGFSLHTGDENDAGKEKAGVGTSKDGMQENPVVIQPVQLWNRFILVPGLQDLIVIDQRAAHERILFEQMLDDLSRQHPTVQKLIWPETCEYAASEFLLLKELLPHLQYLGFDMEEFGHQSFIVHGIPAIMTDLITPRQALEDIMQRYVADQQLSGLKPTEKIAAVVASTLSRKRGESMTMEEMRMLVEQLMTTENPYTSPSGRKTFITFGKEEMFRHFQS
jgi:DNA mismatch repair protein MutL